MFSKVKKNAAQSFKIIQNAISFKDGAPIITEPLFQLCDAEDLASLGAMKDCEQELCLKSFIFYLNLTFIADCES